MWVNRSLLKEVSHVRHPEKLPSHPFLGLERMSGSLRPVRFHLLHPSASARGFDGHLPAVYVQCDPSRRGRSEDARDAPRTHWSGRDGWLPGCVVCDLSGPCGMDRMVSVARHPVHDQHDGHGGLFSADLRQRTATAHPRAFGPSHDSLRTASIGPRPCIRASRDSGQAQEHGSGHPVVRPQGAEDHRDGGQRRGWPPL